MRYEVIPWVVRRTTEGPGPDTGWGWALGTNLFTGEDEAILVSPDMTRDEDGWIWMPAPDDMSGAPEFKQVHPTRHRRSMDESRCQVCGEVSDNLRWIVPTYELKTTSAGLTAITYTPPVCPTCEPIARRLCPWLRQADWKTYVARRVLKYGVLGDLYQFPNTVRSGEVIATKRDDFAPRVVARQRVVRLIDLKELR